MTREKLLRFIFLLTLAALAVCALVGVIHSFALFRRPPGIAINPHRLGDWFQRNGKLDEAEAEFRRAVSVDPTDFVAYSKLGSVLKDKRDFKASIAAYREAVHLRPSEALLQNNLGNAYYAAQDIGKAVQCYARSLELDPKFALAYVNWGNVFFTQKKFDEAGEKYQRAAELNPNLLDAHNGLGVIAAMQGRLDDAIAEFTRVLEIDPNHKNAAANLERARRDKSARAGSALPVGAKVPSASQSH
ncbi:tetratricopeptide repeat protein [Candidatus Sumerlaeota bacterium]|nr:tetratricopeptide repeat protein [Candidatus Sumerlaeota bacterium]